MNFIFTFIDAGCFLTIENHGQSLSQGFYTTIDAFKLSEDYAIFRKNPRCPVHIFFDTHEQRYERSTLPSLGIFKIRKILKYKCHTENPWHQTVTFRRESRDTYFFMDVTLSATQKDWLLFLENSPHLLKKPRLVPLELESLFNSSEANFLAKKRCLIVMYYEELMGLRQIIFFEGKLCAARLVLLDDAQQSKQVLLETEDLIGYLSDTHVIRKEDIGLVFLDQNSLWKEVRSYPHRVLEIYKPQNSISASFKPTVWTKMGLFFLQKKPVFPFPFKVFEIYESQERQRKIFLAGSILCLWILCIGAVILEKYKDLVPQKQLSWQQKIQSLSNVSSTNSPKKAEAELLFQSNLKKYKDLQNLQSNPFELIQKAKSWLHEDLALTHVEWERSPSLDNEGSLLKEMGPENLNLRVVSHKKDSFSEILAQQLGRSFTSYTVSHHKNDKDANMIRIQKTSSSNSPMGGSL